MPLFTTYEFQLDSQFALNTCIM